MLTVLAITISNSQVSLLKKYGSSCHSHFFSKHISIYVIFNDPNFNDTLTDDIVSFEQLNPECLKWTPPSLNLDIPLFQMWV